MAGPLNDFTKKVLKDTLTEDYPHLELPAVVYARVESVKPLERYEIQDLVVYNDESGGSFRGHITLHWYEYCLIVLDRFGHPDPNFPTIPQVRSRKQFRQGAIVAAALPYGELAPAIIGEAAL